MIRPNPILYIVRRCGFSFLLCGVGITVLCVAERYVADYQRRAQKVQKQSDHLQRTEKQLQTVSTLFDPHLSPFLDAITRLQRTSSATFEKNVTAIAMLAGVTHVTLQAVKDRPSAILLNVCGNTEEVVLKFLYGLEKSCLGVPYIEKIILTHTSEGNICAQLYLVRSDYSFPIEIDTTYVLPTSLRTPEFCVFSRTVIPDDQREIRVEGCLFCSKGAQIAISGKWLHVGDQILHFRVKEINPHGVYLEDKHKIFYIEIGASLLCPQGSNSK
ncbi:MAG: hypothetical protein LBD15_01735 [Holosporales bacterium]|jgi:hypothetical protein|nr:hypothetical protein [Holosporales bacterium]